jgi:hypothetical protein
LNGAYVTKIDDKLVLVDPLAAEVIEALNIYNKNLCYKTLELQMDRVIHFTKRIKELNREPNSVVILLANVDNPLGEELANELMPGYDWQQFRDRGEVPFARGLVGRSGIQTFLDNVNQLEGEKLRNANDNVAVLVIDYNTCEIFVM